MRIRAWLTSWCFQFNGSGETFEKKITTLTLFQRHKIERNSKHSSNNIKYNRSRGVEAQWEACNKNVFYSIINSTQHIITIQLNRLVIGFDVSIVVQFNEFVFGRLNIHKHYLVSIFLKCRVVLMDYQKMCRKTYFYCAISKRHRRKYKYRFTFISRLFELSYFIKESKKAN